jgi:hypothetical protein
MKMEVLSKLFLLGVDGTVATKITGLRKPRCLSKEVEMDLALLKRMTHPIGF